MADLLGEDNPSAPEKQSPIDEEIALVLEDIGDEDQQAQVKAEATKTFQDFVRLLRETRRKQKKGAEVLKQLVTEAYANEATRENPVVWQKIARVEEVLGRLEDKVKEAANENPIAFKTYYLLQLRAEKQRFKKHGIVETTHIREQREQIERDARKKLEGRNGVVVLLGPTGSGKTVAARRLARSVAGEKGFEFVSAHTKMTPEDLLSRQGIVAKEVPAAEVPGKIQEHQATWLERNRQGDEDDAVYEERKEQAFADIAEVVKGQSETTPMTTETVLEAVGRAAAEGKPVIIDEFNYLPPATLGALNDLLNPDSNNAQPGFSVIFTGNVGKEYIDRASFDPAFLNRVVNGTFRYTHPPQEIDAPYMGSAISQEERAEGEAPQPRDLFQVAMTHMADGKGNIRAPKDALEQAWNVTRGFSLVQKIVAGEDFRNLGASPEATQQITDLNFRSINLSFRNLNQVIREWKLDGYTQPLEAYVFRDIIQPAATLAPREAAQLLYIFKDWQGLFQGEHWNDLVADYERWNISGTETVGMPKPDTNVELVPLTTDEVARAFSGIEVPEFIEVSPDRQDDPVFEAKLAKAEDAVEAAEAALRAEESLQIVEEMCSDEEQAPQ
jgi:MoxR-like ATPase